MSTRYYDLLKDTFRNGGYKHVIHLSERLERCPDDRYVNVCTGYYNTAPNPISDHLGFKVISSEAFPLLYKARMMGDQYNEEVKRILATYEKWIQHYRLTKDEDELKEMVGAELKNAESLGKRKRLLSVIDQYAKEIEEDFSDFDHEEKRRRAREESRGKRKRWEMDSEEEEEDYDEIYSRDSEDESDEEEEQEEMEYKEDWEEQKRKKRFKIERNKERRKNIKLEISGCVYGDFVVELPLLN